MFLLLDLKFCLSLWHFGISLLFFQVCLCVTFLFVYDGDGGRDLTLAWSPSLPCCYNFQILYLKNRLPLQPLQSNFPRCLVHGDCVIHWAVIHCRDRGVLSSPIHTIQTLRYGLYWLEKNRMCFKSQNFNRIKAFYLWEGGIPDLQSKRKLSEKKI